MMGSLTALKELVAMTIVTSDAEKKKRDQLVQMITDQIYAHDPGCVDQIDYKMAWTTLKDVMKAEVGKQGYMSGCASAILDTLKLIENSYRKDLS